LIRIAGLTTTEPAAPAAAATEVTTPAAKPSDAAAVLIKHLIAVKDFNAVDARATRTDTEGLIAPELVGDLEEHFAVAIERGVALTAPHLALHLQALDRRELVLSANRLARFGEERRTFRGVFRLGDGSCGESHEGHEDEQTNDDSEHDPWLDHAKHYSWPSKRASLKMSKDFVKKCKGLDFSVLQRFR
jgi:hypothetical protein